MILYQQGEYGAFEKLYERYASRIFGYLKTRVHAPGEAEDLLQTVFMKMHSSRLKYNPGFPFLPWLFTVSRHTLIDHFRKQQPLSMAMEEIEKVADQISNRENRSQEKPNWDEILKLIPEQQRELIKLRFEKDLSFEEIAEQSGITEVSARKRLSRTIQGIKRMVAKERRDKT